MSLSKRSALPAAACVAMLAVAGCGGGNAGNAASGGGGSPFSAPGKAKIRGQQISVLLPYKIPQRLLSDFTAKTGVKVNFTVTGWDAVHSKLIVANTAKTYIADVTEFDWSFTGQFAGAGWYEPLEKALSPALVSDLSKADAAFKSAGHTFAACYSNDYRLSVYNDKVFRAAGITAFPRTFGELGTVVDRLKRAGVQYPLSLPMGATEGGVTPWYLLTLSMGGQLFDKNFKPVFADSGSPAHRALQFEVDAVKKGWVSPGSVTLDDTPAFDKFTAGANAIALASSPGNLATANDPSQSSIAPNAKPGLFPGDNGPGTTFGLPEGLAIPVTAEHKDAARAFIEWWMEPANQRVLYKQAGMLPCRSSVVASMARSGELGGGKVLSDELAHLVPLFPQGAPKWYSQFSSDAQGLLNAAVKGNMSVDSALQQLASKATQLAAGGS